MAEHRAEAPRLGRGRNRIGGGLLGVARLSACRYARQDRAARAAASDAPGTSTKRCVGSRAASRGTTGLPTPNLLASLAVGGCQLARRQSRRTPVLSGSAHPTGGSTAAESGDVLCLSLRRLDLERAPRRGSDAQR